MEMDLVDSSARLQLLSDLIGAAEDQGHIHISKWLEPTLLAHRDGLAGLLQEAAVRIAALPVTPDDAYEKRTIACAFGRAKNVLGIIRERHGL